MDLSRVPPARYIPGRQEAIDHAGRIDKKPFLISISFFFGVAILSAVFRFGIRIFGRRQIRWDDVFVLLATMTLIAAFGTSLKSLNTLYLIEAMNKKVAFPFREDIPNILAQSKWSWIFASLNWTSVYMVKFAFMNFFHALIKGLSKRVTLFYWSTVAVLTVFWIYTVLNPLIICPHFGADAVKCSADKHHHTRSLAGNAIVATMDIICDFLIVALPLLVLKKSMMPLSQKASIAALLCLSVAMIICALIRLAGSITDTAKSNRGTAPVWATYWSMMEGNISLIMASVIVIRGVFIARTIQEDRQKQNSMMARFGRRLLSTLRLSGSSRSSRRSPQRSDRDGNFENFDQSPPPKIPTQPLTRGTLAGMRTFISGGKRKSGNQAETLASVDTAYILEDLNYHNVRRNEATRPIATPESSRIEGLQQQV